MIEKIVIQRQAHDGIILPSVILKRRAGKDILYFKVLEKSGKNWIAKQVEVSKLRRLIDRLFKW